GFQTYPVEDQKQHQSRQSQLDAQCQIYVVYLDPQITARLIHGNGGSANPRSDQGTAEYQFAGHQRVTPALLRRTTLVLLDIGDRAQTVEIGAWHQWQAADDDQQDGWRQEAFSPAAEPPQIDEIHDPQRQESSA